MAITINFYTSRRRKNQKALFKDRMDSLSRIAIKHIVFRKNFSFLGRHKANLGFN